jgi:branched-subunit amino acid aminotransferase/4-amino-4-deoxychorismate lyase
MARMEAEDAGADDAILLNYDGFVCEGCTSNVFIVKSGQLITPDVASGALPGIVRQTILDIAGDSGVSAMERPVQLWEIESADEVFMTSSVREVAPVRVLNGVPVGQGLHDVALMFEREYRLRTEI